MAAAAGDSAAAAASHAAKSPQKHHSRLDSRARVQPRPPGPASAALAVSAVARLPREQAGTVSIASGAQARRVVRAGTANAERGRALGAGRVGARASAPWSGPGGREPTRPLGDLRAGQQPGAQDDLLLYLDAILKFRLGLRRLGSLHRRHILDLVREPRVGLRPRFVRRPELRLALRLALEDVTPA